jgi:hypothetical protein
VDAETNTSLIAYARPALTEWDELLKQGYDRDSARRFVAEEIDAILAVSKRY